MKSFHRLIVPAVKSVRKGFWRHLLHPQLAVQCVSQVENLSTSQIMLVGKREITHKFLTKFHCFKMKFREILQNFQKSRTILQRMIGVEQQWIIKLFCNTFLTSDKLHSEFCVCRKKKTISRVVDRNSKTKNQL